MRVIRLVAGLTLGPVAALVLAGCSHSASQAQAPSAAQLAAAKTYKPSTGAFAAVPAAQLLSAGTTATTSCNLDAVDGKPSGSEPLQRSGSALLSGWAGDAATGAVPTGVQVVLTGTQDYAIDAATGKLRTDVAAATHKPALATSGYAVNANLSAVAPGQYGVTLLYSVDGKSLKCTTKVKLSVQ